jgi:hypothetical protein
MSHERVRKLKKLAAQMDQSFTIPGTSMKFGWDSILGLVPGIGDTAGLAVSSYIIAAARDMGAPGWLVAVMIWNVFVDWLIGLIPFLGDIFDIGWKANMRNIALMEMHILKNPLIEGDIIEGKVIR